MKNVLASLLALWAFYYFVTAPGPSRRGPTSSLCKRDGSGCPFLNLAHRGAPYISAENTLGSFQEAIERGANALEIDMVFTRDEVPVVYHDRTPSEFIALIRQAGLEGFTHIPYNPDVGDPYRRPVDELTFEELRNNYGYAPREGFSTTFFYRVGLIHPQ